MKFEKSNYLYEMDQPMEPSMVGWKFARLKELAVKELIVPKFFCLTKSFYEQATSSLRTTIETKLSSINFKDPENIKQVSEEIRALIIGIELSAIQKSSIFNCFDSHFKPDALVAVRSSTVGLRLEESEDSASNPFAGMSDSFLYVRREQLIEKILLCWASGYNTESIIYRNKQGLNLLGFGVAVGVQEMVFGSRSFVLFTCDPNKASKDAVIVAGYGIGEGVVQEKVPVDHYFRNYYTNETHSTIADKNLMVTFDQKKGYGITTENVREDLRKRSCLSADEIEKLIHLGREIENIFGSPQDIEGTFTEAGEIYVLQSRPIAIDYRRQRIWTSSNITESFPGVTTALTFSLAKYFYRVIFYDMYKRGGTFKDTLHDNHEILDNMIGFIKGRIYYSLTAFYFLHSQHPTFILFKKTWEKMIGLSTSFQTPHWSGNSKKRQKLLQFFWGWARLASTLFTHKNDMKEFSAWWERSIQPFRGESFDGKDPLLLISLFRSMWREVGKYWGITLNNDMVIQLSYAAIEHFFRREKLKGKDSIISGLLCGDENLTSVDIILSAVGLAEQVRANQELVQAFTSKNPMDVWEDIREKKLEQSFCKAFELHLYLYGDRGLQELKVEIPNLRDTPWLLVKMIQEYASSGVTVKEINNKEKTARQNAEKELDEILKQNPIRLFILKKLFSSMRNVIGYRENSRYCRSELYGFSKNIFFAIGDWLVKKEFIRQKEDIVHLTMDEIFGFIEGMGTIEDLQSLISLRKKEYEQNQKLEVPMQLTTLGPLPQNVVTIEREEAEKVGVLKGLGSSSGCVRGTARVVLDPNSYSGGFDNVILIARETDPGWLFLMLASKGIVVERGSMLSHTAITGRKFGIPTVVAVHEATRLIPDGAEIEIDGGSGLVKILAE